MKPDHPSVTVRGKWRKRILLALLAPVVAIGVLESALRLAGFGQPTSYFVRAPKGPDFVANPRFTNPFLGRTLSRPVIPVVLSREKPERTYRILVFGESAAAGEPNPAASFARILEVMLEESFPATRFEVINTGITAINSHVLLKIVRDCRGFGGDLYIVYTGNNEVIGPYSAVGAKDAAKMPALWVIRSGIRAQSSRTGQLAARLLGNDPGRRGWGGLAMFVENQVPADDPRLPVVRANFRSNLEAILAEARRAGAKVLVSTVLTNLRDCAPFLSAHRAGLSAEDQARWEERYRLGREKEAGGDAAGAAERYRSALAIDDRFAELHFRLARCLLAAGQDPAPRRSYAGARGAGPSGGPPSVAAAVPEGRMAEPGDELARQHFALARDLDTLRFRADTDVNRIIREAAGGRERDGVYLLDAEKEVRLPAAARGIPGDEMFYEHVHFRFEGNHAVAAAMFRRVSELLPPDVRAGGKAEDPPDLAACADRLVYTAFTRCTDLNDILTITSNAPFPKEKAARDAAELKRLEGGVTPDLLAGAADRHRQRLRERPDDLLLRRRLAGVEVFRGRLDLAEEQFRLVLEQCPDVHSRYWLGRALAAQNRFEESAQEFRAVLRDSPGHLGALAALAAVLHRTGKLDEAIRGYREVLELRPGDEDIQRALEQALQKRKK